MTGAVGVTSAAGVTGEPDAARLRAMRWWDIGGGVLDLEHELFEADSWSAELFWSELADPATRHFERHDFGRHDPQPHLYSGYGGSL